MARGLACALSQFPALKAKQAYQQQQQMKFAQGLKTHDLSINSGTNQEQRQNIRLESSIAPQKTWWYSRI